MYIKHQISNFLSFLLACSWNIQTILSFSYQGSTAKVCNNFHCQLMSSSLSTLSDQAYTMSCSKCTHAHTQTQYTYIPHTPNTHMHNHTHTNTPQMYTYHTPHTHINHTHTHPYTHRWGEGRGTKRERGRERERVRDSFKRSNYIVMNLCIFHGCIFFSFNCVSVWVCAHEFKYQKAKRWHWIL